MALKNTLIIGALLVSFVASGVTEGQINKPSPRFRYKKLESAENTRPYATPGVFDYDAQVFAPLEFTDGKEKKPNSGFLLLLSIRHTRVSRKRHESERNRIRFKPVQLISRDHVMISDGSQTMTTDGALPIRYLTASTILPDKTPVSPIQ